ncbi:MAG TPA: hypothetical protein VG672_10235, partial [Bryobacteraceae bacterium]|nr:hypothetical protein [Bryobacteraceae bacterium]
MKTEISRRAALAAMAAAPAAGATEASIDPEVVRRHDAGLERLLRLQVTDPASPHRGAYPDDYGI